MNYTKILYFIPKCIDLKKSAFIRTRLHTYTTLPVLLHVYSYKSVYHSNAVHETFCSPTRDILSKWKTEKLVIFLLEAKYDQEIGYWSFLKEQRISLVKLFLFHGCIRRVIREVQI